MTNSFLTYAPSVDDQDKILSCRVEHPLLQQKEMELSWKLMIQSKSITFLIDESIDLYFFFNFLNDI